MKASTILKLAVIAEIFLIPVGVAVSFWADSFLPENIVALEGSQGILSDLDSIGPGMVVLLLGGVAMSGVWIASVIGLLKLKRWGAWLYLFATLSGLPLYFMFGMDVRHPIDQVFDEIYRFIPGFIIGLAFFSDAIPKKDSERAQWGHVLIIDTKFSCLWC